MADGYLIRTREGRRNRYQVNPRGQLRHPLFADVEIGRLIDALRERNGDG